MELLGLDVSDHAGRRSRRVLPERRRRGRRLAVAITAATALLAAPAGALAADPPTILTAGIDGGDKLYATWSVAPGTTFFFVEIATTPDADPTLPYFFLQDNFAGYCSDPTATCTATSYNSGYPIVRDRRYYARVAAKVNGTNDRVASTIWVIDDAKPQVAGKAPVSTVPATNKPVAGHPLGTTTPPPVAPPPPPPAAPAAAIKLMTLPRTIGSLQTKGVRLQVGCNVTCSPFGRLTLGSPTIGTKSIDMIGGGIRVLTIKPNAAGRRRLRGRSRARIKVAVAVSPIGGATTKYSKSFTVRR